MKRDSRGRQEKDLFDYTRCARRETLLVRTPSVRYAHVRKELGVPTSSATRDDRIELRASREEKRVLAAAAAYERLDLTSFVMRTALPAAEEIVARHERMTLTARDSARVLELLEHPPKPTAALRAAAKRRRNRR